jgi:flagellar biosynthesis GTPase FlhF
VTYVYIGRTQVQYGYSDDEMFGLLWIARTRRVPLGDVVVSYGNHGRSLGLVCTEYGILPSAYYVDVDEHVDMSIRYRRLYIAHWSRHYTTIQYTNADIIGLLHLRMGCEYYGMQPREYLRVECSGADFRWQAQANCHRAGSTGYDCRREKVVVVERPWNCRDHDDFIQRQNTWVRTKQVNAREREVSAREREVAEREREAECREREAKMREDAARRKEAEANAASKRAEHDRQVAEFEKRRADQAKERNEAERKRLENERQMAEYDRKKADYEKQKEENRHKNEENEKKMADADRKAAIAKRQEDERKQ